VDVLDFEDQPYQATRRSWHAASLEGQPSRLRLRLQERILPRMVFEREPQPQGFDIPANGPGPVVDREFGEIQPDAGFRGSHEGILPGPPPGREGAGRSRLVGVDQSGEFSTIWLKFHRNRSIVGSGNARLSPWPKNRVRRWKLFVWRS